MSLGLRIFLPFAAGYFLSYLLRNANAVIAPDLTRELGLTATDLGFLTSAYLFAFSAFQLPLGILLDRFGPRRVESALMLIAAAGCALFGLGEGMTQLAIGRAAIGLGVSACLMASFKAFYVWFPADRLPSLNGAVMVAGGLGALSATAPIAWAAPLVGWRGLFVGLAVLCALSAVALYFSPEKAAAGSRESLAEQLRGLGRVVRSPIFWRYAPQGTLMGGGFMAVQGLWAIPWLMQVDGYSRDAAAGHLLLTTIAMTLSFLFIALFIGRIARQGISLERVLVLAMATGIASTAGIVFALAPTRLLWFVYGAAFAFTNVAYSQLAKHFPPAMAGRVQTALNLGSFLGAFALQWAYGAALDALVARGWALAEAHRATLGSLIVLQTMAFGWYALGVFRLGGRER